MGGDSRFPSRKTLVLLLALGLCAGEGAESGWARRVGRRTPALSQAQQRIPRQSKAKTAAVEAVVRDPSGRGVAAATVSLRNIATNQTRQVLTTGDGVFRFVDLPAGRYEIKVEREGFQTYSRADLVLSPPEVIEMEITLQPLPGAPAPLGVPKQLEVGPTPPAPPQPPSAPYGPLPPRPEQAPTMAPPAEVLPPANEVFIPEPDRWQIPMPAWKRYPGNGEEPYKKGHWWDPFNRNKLKGDYPIFGQRNFFSFTGVSNTFFDGRRLPSPSDVSAARPGSSDFFGRGEQALLQQNFRLTFDLFRGDTSFRPVDWRFRVTPEFNVNELATRELGLVNIDVRQGKQRFDSHIGFQEAFLEYKIHDLSPYYDFLSVRAGIQSFTSDFRGFLFSDEEPGVRLFGNWDNNLWQYNVAYFYMVEKDTNSGLNTWNRRHQQVLVANVFRQDFIKPGYTAQFSISFNKDEPTIHFDTNDFLVRPAPIGAVVSSGRIRAHRIEVGYFGWTGDGHFGRLNITHAFYQAFGEDSFNTIAGRPVTVNAQMAAVELSVDKDWARIKGSVFYASGDGKPRDGRARGFDAILDFPEFAGGIFSLWNREGIRLTGTGVTLTPPNSLLPSLRSSKDEGQANFVNPGIFLANAGATFDVTPKLRGVVNVNYLRFMRTEPLELVLFQAPIRHNIGVDYNVGLIYRPPLTENIKITVGAAALTPGQGFKDIYTAKTLFSLFANVRFEF